MEFGRLCLVAHREQVSDLDGAWLQDAAIGVGLMHWVEVNEACNVGRADVANCWCAEYHDTFPAMCLRMSAEVKATCYPPENLGEIDTGQKT